MSADDSMALHQQLRTLLLGHFVMNMSQLETPYEVAREVDNAQVAKIRESFELIGVQSLDPANEMTGVLKGDFPSRFKVLNWGDTFPIGFKVILLSGHHRRAALCEHESEQDKRIWLVKLYSNGESLAINVDLVILNTYIF